MAQWGVWEQPLFGAKEEIDDYNSTNINMQQDKKVKKVREGGFCVLCVCVCVCFLNVFIKPSKFFTIKIWSLPTN